MGSAAAPALIELHDASGPSLRRRLLVLGALGQAGADGLAGVRKFVLARGAAGEDQVMGLMVLALARTAGRQAPSGPPGIPSLWTALGGSRAAAAVQVAALLANPESAVAAGTKFSVDDPGVVAAALRGGWLVRPADLRKLLQDAVPRSGNGTTTPFDLIFRGACLAADPVALLERDLVTERFRDASTTRSAAHEDAVFWLEAAAGQPVARAQLTRVLRDVPHGLLGRAVSMPALWPHLPAGWVRPVPSALTNDKVFVSVAFVLTQRLDVIEMALPKIEGDEFLRRPALLALAFRLLAAPRESRRVFADLPGELANDLAGQLVIAIADEERPVSSPSTPDPAVAASEGDLALHELVRAAALDLLTGDELRRHVEDALWCAGAHPGWIRFDAERRLIRDLLLTGRKGVLQQMAASEPPVDYVARGLPKRVFESGALDYFVFTANAVRRTPQRLRLR